MRVHSLSQPFDHDCSSTYGARKVRKLHAQAPRIDLVARQGSATGCTAAARGLSDEQWNPTRQGHTSQTGKPPLPLLLLASFMLFNFFSRELNPTASNTSMHNSCDLKTGHQQRKRDVDCLVPRQVRAARRLAAACQEAPFHLLCERLIMQATAGHSLNILHLHGILLRAISAHKLHSPIFCVSAVKHLLQTAVMMSSVPGVEAYVLLLLVPLAVFSTLASLKPSASASAKVAYATLSWGKSGFAMVPCLPCR